jgi:hypothetical protein
VLNGCGKPWRGEWSALKAAIRGANAAGNRGRPADEPGVGTSADADDWNKKSCVPARARCRAQYLGLGAIPLDFPDRSQVYSRSRIGCSSLRCRSTPPRPLAKFASLYWSRLRTSSSYFLQTKSSDPATVPFVLYLVGFSYGRSILPRARAIFG